MSGAVQPFISTVAGSLDAKGRICIPANYRQVLAAQATAGVYLCPSFFEPAIEGFGEALLQKVHQRLSTLDPFFSPEHDDQAFAVLSSTQLFMADEAGRLRLPDALAAHARLTDKVLFIGLGDKFQIWNPDVFAPIQAERLERARASRTGNATASAGGAHG